jgi:hypothetical protein
VRHVWIRQNVISSLWALLQGLEMTRQYYILTLDPRMGEVFGFIQDHKLTCEVHLNRTRFWVPEGSVLTEFLLRFSDCCPYVDDTVDLATGLPR